MQSDRRQQRRTSEKFANSHVPLVLSLDRGYLFLGLVKFFFVMFDAFEHPWTDEQDFGHLLNAAQRTETEESIQRIVTWSLRK
jgi:hypothetical protein